MTGLDTNILVRLFVDEEDASQAIVARRLLNQFTEEEPGFVSIAVIVELNWVLRRRYGFPSLIAADAIHGLLQAETIEVQNAMQIYMAVDEVRTGAGDFADVLIGRLDEWAGCSTTLTFDKKASRLDGFTRVR